MLPEKFNKLLKDFCVELSWMHWNKLGVRGMGSNHKLSSSVDPEYLILMSCITGDYDARIFSSMTEWLAKYESIIILDRLKQILTGDSREKLLGEKIVTVIRFSLNSTQQSRWKKLFKKYDSINLDKFTDYKSNVGALETHKKVVAQNTLMPLRYLFGPSIRADLLYYILVMSSQSKTSNDYIFTASRLQEVFQYDLSAIFRVLNSLKNANVIEEVNFREHDERNTFFTLSGEHIFFGRFARHSESLAEEPKQLPDSQYIKWKAIYDVVKNIDDMLIFNEDLKKKRKGDYSAIMKRQLHDLLQKLHDLKWSAMIPINFKKTKDVALEDISIDKYLDDIKTCLEKILSSI